MSVEYAIIIKNKTRLEALIERFNTKAQARFYIERMGGDFLDYEREQEIFYTSLHKVQQSLSPIIKHKIVERSFLPSFIFNTNQVVITVGQDGLVANTAKYVNGLPVVAINPDKERFDGVLMPFDPENFISAVESVINNKQHCRSTFMAEARLNDGQRLLAFNDLFIGISSHVSARYTITYNNSTETHSSSGLIVSTAAGGTGWMSSMFNMSFGLQKFIEKNSVKKRRPRIREGELLFAVREPFESKRTQVQLVAGIVGERSSLVIESLMPANGLIFSDGIESDFIRFNSGAIATIGIAKERANLVIPYDLPVKKQQ